MVCLAWTSGCERKGSQGLGTERIVSDSILPEPITRRLREGGWTERVGDGLALWVSVARQQLVGVQGERAVFAYLCSTAERGIGNTVDSNQTPLGWHEIAERYGDGSSWGAVFKERRATGRVWDPANATSQDLILTRIMWLNGLEPGVNAGPGIDSHQRYIYIHGTPEEHKLGTPASHGCIRLSNDAVMAVFNQTPSGTKVLITEW